MKWFLFLIILFQIRIFTVHMLPAASNNRRRSSHISINTNPPNRKPNAIYGNDNDKLSPDSFHNKVVEVDTAQCPQGCACQYARWLSLSSSRWINYIQQRYVGKKLNRTAKNFTIIPSDPMGMIRDPKGDGKGYNNNPSRNIEYDGDDTNADDDDDDQDDVDVDDGYVDDDKSKDTYDSNRNPFVKQATCIMETESDAEHLAKLLPHDIQTLILLYSGSGGQTTTVNSSIFKPFNRLTTLEMRGSLDGNLRLVIDTPMTSLRFVNFELITLMGSETYNRPQNPKHPKEMFNYKPHIELINNLDIPDFTDLNEYMDEVNATLGLNDMEIMPYEIYREEVKKARMPTFYDWRQLQILRINNCKGINEFSWEMFLGADALQHLYLEANNIVRLQPFAFSGATQLRTLSLAHNKIEDLHYRDLAGLFRLELLDLNGNRLSKLTELSFPPLPLLKFIDFRNNPIHYIFPATFWVMNGTQEMKLGSKQISLELWANMPFKMLNKLKVLHINNVSIATLNENIFKDLISLKVLKLHGYINSVEFDAFASLQHLNELDLSNCQLRDISMDAFVGCKHLSIINLGNNNLSYLPPGIFDEQTDLTEIYLENNNLHFLPTTFFQQRKLKLARLNNNPWNCDCNMMNWKAKITNQEVLEHNERCINDFQTGRKISCRKLQAYKFNHKYAPRCENYNGRSVYYVLRKQIECNPFQAGNSPNQTLPNTHSYLRQKSIQSKPHWRKLQERRQQQQYQNKQRRNPLNSYPHISQYYNNSSLSPNHLLWQLQLTNNKLQTSVTHKTIRNSLDSNLLNDV